LIVEHIIRLAGHPIALGVGEDDHPITTLRIVASELNTQFH
jgi:hypothetical protein